MLNERARLLWRTDLFLRSVMIRACEVFHGEQWLRATLANDEWEDFLLHTDGYCGGLLALKTWTIIEECRSPKKQLLWQDHLGEHWSKLWVDNLGEISHQRYKWSLVAWSTTKNETNKAIINPSSYRRKIKETITDLKEKRRGPRSYSFLVFLTKEAIKVGHSSNFQCIQEFAEFILPVTVSWERNRKSGKGTNSKHRSGICVCEWNKKNHRLMEKPMASIVKGGTKIAEI
jgi:hypothetical protein